MHVKGVLATTGPHSKWRRPAPPRLDSYFRPRLGSRYAASDPAPWGTGLDTRLSTNPPRAADPCPRYAAIGAWSGFVVINNAIWCNLLVNESCIPPCKPSKKMSTTKAIPKDLHSSEVCACTNCKN